jgi:hypothetical protein
MVIYPKVISILDSIIQEFSMSESQINNNLKFILISKIMKVFVSISNLWLIGLAFLLACSSNESDPNPNPTVNPPSALVYSTSSLTTCIGDAKSSVKPTLNGTPPFTFQATVSPANANITTDSEGKINVGANATAGTFKITMRVSNSAGNQTFTDIFTVTVNQSDPNGISFNDDVLPLIQSRCAPCHTGGAQPNYTVFATAKSSINSIISRTESGSMPQGGPPLTTAELNTLKGWLSNCLPQ